jgi:cell division protein FtsW (lipid II flippase)
MWSIHHIFAFLFEEEVEGVPQWFQVGFMDLQSSEEIKIFCIYLLMELY